LETLGVAHPIVDIELTEPLPNLEERCGDEGMGLLIRHQQRAVGFILLPANADVRRDHLARRISAEVGTDILVEKLCAELVPPAAKGSLPSLTVAICTRDRPELLGRCLDSLRRLVPADDGEEGEFDILVVDNAPTGDATKQAVEQIGGVSYVREVRPGLNFARNRALQEAAGDFVAYLDDDVVVDRGWLVGLQQALSQHSDAIALTGQVLPLELATRAQLLFERRGGFRHGFSTRRYSGDDEDDGELYPCRTGIFGVGCNMVFRRHTVLELGGFDEALDTGPPLPGGGDHDIFYRVVRAGGPLVYEPRMLVFHQHRKTMELLRHQYWTWGLSVMAVATKWYREDPMMRSRWRWLVYRWFRSQAFDLLRALSGRHVLPPGCILWEIAGGIVGLFGEYDRSSRRSEIIRRRYQ
jgi:glycosyltransferase involved in cell wall biosynthesis